jgi:hypothetical protein
VSRRRALVRRRSAGPPATCLVFTWRLARHLAAEGPAASGHRRCTGTSPPPPGSLDSDASRRAVWTEQATWLTKRETGWCGQHPTLDGVQSRPCWRLRLMMPSSVGAVAAKLPTPPHHACRLSAVHACTGRRSMLGVGLGARVCRSPRPPLPFTLH